MLRLLAATALAVVALPASALASTSLTGPAVKPWMTGCVARSSVPTPDLTLRVLDTPHPGASYASPWTQTLYMDRLDKDSGRCYTLRHEIGHVFDWVVLTNDHRHHLACRILGEASANPWWGVLNAEGRWQGGEGLSSPLERFAEVYALAASVKKVGRQLMINPSLSYGVYDLLFDRRDRFRYQRLREAQSYIRFIAKTASPRPSGDDNRQLMPEC